MNIRPKRLRTTQPVRSLVRETRISRDSLIYPLFIVEDKGVKSEIGSMPGQYRYSPDTVCQAVEESLEHGIDKFLLFGIPKEKDDTGSGAWAKDGIVQQGLAEISRRFPQALLIPDLCLCEYTKHGHCGALKGELIDNDKTLELLAKTAVSQARAGAHIVAPSSMTDGQVSAIRAGLDKAGFTDVSIMSYSAKYSSAFYGPFREAADSAPGFGDRRSYQMDYHNIREAVRESKIDEEQSADYLMVKPALSYLDVISKIRRETNLPLAAYSVSGEYSMIKQAAKAGLLDEYKIMCETAVSIYRAGADILISYYARELADAIKKGDIG